MVVTDDTVVVGSVTLNSINGLNGNNVTITTVGGRNDEFNRIADEVLFPIYFQQLVGREPLQDTDAARFAVMLDAPKASGPVAAVAPHCHGTEPHAFGELAAVVLEAGIGAEFARVCVEDTIPFDRRREAQALPNVQRIIEAARKLVSH